MLIESKRNGYIYISDNEEYYALRQLVKEIPIEEYEYKPSFSEMLTDTLLVKAYM